MLENLFQNIGLHNSTVVNARSHSFSVCKTIYRLSFKYLHHYIRRQKTSWTHLRAREHRIDCHVDGEDNAPLFLFLSQTRAEEEGRCVLLHRRVVRYLIYPSHYCIIHTVYLIYPSHCYIIHMHDYYTDVRTGLSLIPTQEKMSKSPGVIGFGVP